MKLREVLATGLLLAVLGSLPPQAAGQFEFPVQLIGFPVIIIAVRLANFIKKMTYALNPNTYRSRSRRGLPVMDTGEVEKRLVQEMGEKVCVYESVCSQYAMQSLQPEADVHLDWEEIFRKFAVSPKDKAEFYLLSVFLGDIVGSPELCRQLSKRRPCGEDIPYAAQVPEHEGATTQSYAPSPMQYAPGATHHPQISVRSTPQPFFLPMVPQLGFTPQS